MKAFEYMTFELCGHKAKKAIRVADSIHPDGTPYTDEEYAAAFVSMVRFKAVEAARDIAMEIWGTIGASKPPYPI